jgi:hypothetical protein
MVVSVYDVYLLVPKGNTIRLLISITNTNGQTRLDIYSDFKTNGRSAGQVP